MNGGWTLVEISEINVSMCNYACKTADVDIEDVWNSIKSEVAV